MQASKTICWKPSKQIKNSLFASNTFFSFHNLGINTTVQSGSNNVGISCVCLAHLRYHLILITCLGSNTKEETVWVFGPGRWSLVDKWTCCLTQRVSGSCQTNLSVFLGSQSLVTPGSHQVHTIGLYQVHTRFTPSVHTRFTPSVNTRFTPSVHTIS